MFDTEIKELYKYQSKETLVHTFSLVRQDRKSVILYDFDTVKWIVMPKDNEDVKCEEIESYKKYDSTKIMFKKNDYYNDIPNTCNCRSLTKKDQESFLKFHNACSLQDQDDGSVSLDDPTVYGCFVEEELVSVSSLWNWGNQLSDIGVLTHPDFRGKGYALNVCKTLLNETERLFIWRCDENNTSSFKLAKALGFIESGQIYCLRKD